MARFSQQMLAGLLNPTYQKELTSAARGLGGAPGRMMTRQATQRSQAEIQELLKQHANNPAKLQQLANEYRAKGNAEAAQAFTNAATQATTAQTEKKTALQEKGEIALFNMARMMQASPSEDISRNNMKRQNYLTAAEGYGVSPERAMQILQESVTTTKDKFKVVGNRVFNTETEQYVEPSEAAELLPLSALKDAVTPESLIEYVQTGDKSVLDAVVEDEQLNQSVVSDLLATDNVLKTVDKALGLTDEYWVVGYDLAKLLPLPTDAKQMETYVQTLKSNLAFDRLQQMRDRSKTGGALGQVSNIELGLLESSVAALDPGSKNFKDQLAEVRNQYENFRSSLLGIAPNDPKYMVDDDTGKIYYDFEGEYIDLEEAAKTDRFRLSPNPKTGGRI